MPMTCIFAGLAWDITGVVGVINPGAICPETGHAGVEA